MRRFIAIAALLGLTACGGEEEAMPAQVAAPGSEQVEAAACYGAPVECFCKSFKTQDACRAASPTCVWAFNRCSPAWE